MLSRVKNFYIAEDGAVTVDWVVLTAAVVLMAGVVILSLLGSTGDLGEYLSIFMTDSEAGAF